MIFLKNIGTSLSDKTFDRMDGSLVKQRDDWRGDNGKYGQVRDDS